MSVEKYYREYGDSVNDYGPKSIDLQINLEW